MRLSYGFFILGFSISLLTAMAAQADAVLRPCQGVKNTAGLQACVSSEYAKAQEALTENFQNIADQLSPDEGAAFRQVQKSWLMYRDEQCAWEVGRQENESLKRLAELTCLTLLTQSRIQNLTRLDKSLPAYEGFLQTPRWINSLSKENPALYWNYAGRINADLNCDGISEKIILGLELNPGSKNDTDSSSIQNVVMGVVEDVKTGLPAVKIWEMPSELSDDRNEGTAAAPETCGVNPSPLLTKFESPQKPPAPAAGAETDIQSRTCSENALKIRRGLCGDAVFYWDGQAYKWAERPHAHSKK